MEIFFEQKMLYILTKRNPGKITKRNQAQYTTSLTVENSIRKMGDMSY
jgi:hypothetical protein